MKEQKRITVNVGYARKISMHEHGGLQYEMADITESLIAEKVLIDEAPTLAAKLYKKCVIAVEKRIKLLDSTANKNLTATEASSPKSGIELDKEEMDEITTVFNDITMSSSMKALRKCAKEVKNLAPSLKKSQIKFLRAHYKERLRSLKK